MARRLVLSLTVACLAAASPAAARERWVWPVRGAVIGRFHVGSDRFAAGQRRGIDLAAPVGAPVRAACSGRVSFAGTVGASGRVVAVACGPLSATYLHLGHVAVRRGAFVVAGESIATVGTSGRPGEPVSHLALGARILARPRGEGYVDPRRLLGEDPPGGPPALPVGRPGGPPAVAPAGTPEPALVPMVRPAPAPAPVHAPARVRAPRATGLAVPRAGLPLAALWLPAGFALLIGAVALTAARRLRADLDRTRYARAQAWRERLRVATRR